MAAEEKVAAEERVMEEVAAEVVYVVVEANSCHRILHFHYRGNSDEALAAAQGSLHKAFADLVAAYAQES